MKSPISCSELINTSDIKFGTSGARGLVEDFSPEVCAAFTTAFLTCLKLTFDVKELFIGTDNRLSSPEIAKYCGASASALGIKVRYFGVLPTPALAYYSMQHSTPCIVVTGSHIPFDRNGLKFYSPEGEISKNDEIAIVNCTELACFNESFKLPAIDNNAVEAYIKRNKEILEENTPLKGRKIGVYEHSSAGRDIYRKLFEELGAEVISLGRTEEFVPIDTEAVSDEDKKLAKKWSTQYSFDAIFSTDGDGDRPLIADENGTWLNGDIVGLLASSSLGIEAVATPVSCNTAIEKSANFRKVIRTKIGSPYVIAEFKELNQIYSSVAGFEANGGYILGSDCKYYDKIVSALPTRDALLPFLLILAESIKQNTNISSLLKNLPLRYTSSDRLKNIPTHSSKVLLEHAIGDINSFLKSISILDKASNVSTIDGLRITLENGRIVHIRPSGNAPELRIYIETEDCFESEQLLELVMEKMIQLLV